MESKIIEIKQLSAGYEQKIVLREIDLMVCDRDFLGIIGPNGGGKTTLIKLILKLMKPYSGAIQFYKEGHAVDSLSIGYLPQYNQIDKNFPISVFETVLSGLSGQTSWRHTYTDVHHQQAAEMIAKMGLGGFEKRTIGSLSGGQLQRVLLGRAIVSNPQLIILDEPNTYIDKRSEGRLYEQLEEMNKTAAIILVSHDLGTVLQNVKSIACVNETLDYHPSNEVSEAWLSKNFECPIELLGHGDLPHRVLCTHK